MIFALELTFAVIGSFVSEDVELVQVAKVLEVLSEVVLRPAFGDLAHEHLDGIFVRLSFQRIVLLFVLQITVDDQRSSSQYCRNCHWMDDRRRHVGRVSLHILSLSSWYLNSLVVGGIIILDQ